MTPDQLAIEAQLRELHAAALDESFLTRLEASAEGTLTQLSLQEIRFEESLRKSVPVKLSADFMAEMEKIVRHVPFPADQNIVQFPKTASSPPVRRQRPIWGAAAAVALIGAATALLMPSGGNPKAMPRQTASNGARVASSAAGNFIPASFNRDLSEVHDEGVIWKSDKRPHSVVRVTYKDQMILKDANGRTVQVEQPRVEYMLVPAHTD